MNSISVAKFQLVLITLLAIANFSATSLPTLSEIDAILEEKEEPFDEFIQREKDADRLIESIKLWRFCLKNRECKKTFLKQVRGTLLPSTYFSPNYKDIQQQKKHKQSFFDSDWGK